jgi:sugar lactone lactonase YvrE
MFQPNPVLSIVAGVTVAFALGIRPYAQQGQGAEPNGPAVTSIMTNPYRIVENWPHLGNIKLGAAIGILPDGKGGVWVNHRQNGNDPAILHIDASGNIVKRFDVTFSSSHGMCRDADGNFWVLDSGTMNDSADTGVRGNQIFVFNQDGKLLRTLGKAGVSKPGTDTFLSPTACIAAPNGDMIIADGHWVRPKVVPQDGDRLVWYTKDGKFVKEFGRLGAQPGEFMGPHGLAFDSQGRLFVVDRSNNRIQIFDKNMNYLDDWKHFGRPSGIWILKDDTLIVSDSESVYGGFRPMEFGLSGLSKPGERSLPRNGGWKNGVRIGSAKDGSLKYFIPGTRPEGLAAEADGSVIYAGLTNGCDASPSGSCLQKWVKK